MKTKELEKHCCYYEFAALVLEASIQSYLECNLPNITALIYLGHNMYDNADNKDLYYFQESSSFVLGKRAKESADMQSAGIIAYDESAVDRLLNEYWLIEELFLYKRKVWGKPPSDAVYRRRSKGII